MHLSVDSSEEAFVFLTVANMHVVAFFFFFKGGGVRCSVAGSIQTGGEGQGQVANAVKR